MEQLLDGAGDLLNFDGPEQGLQRNVFPWIGFDDPFKEVESKLPGHKTITASEVVHKHGVPRKELQSYIRDEIEEAEMFGSLPSTMLFVVTYALMCLVHDDAVSVRAVEESIKRSISSDAKWAFDGDFYGHKTLEDVNSAAAFWSWTSKGLLPLLNRQMTTVAEGRNISDPLIASQIQEMVGSDRGVLLTYNRILYGIRFTLQKSPEIPCKSSKALLKFWNRPCYGRSYEIDPETWTARTKTRPDNVTWFYTWEDLEVMQQRAFFMEAEGWVDASTEKVEIAIPIYNAEIGLHTLFTINCFFSRGGSMWKQMLAMSSFAGWWTYQIYMLYDLAWLILLLQIIRNELKEVMWYCKHRSCSAIWSEYVGFWNMVDWASVIMGSTIVILAGMCWTEMGDVNHYMVAVPGYTHPDFEKGVLAYMAALHSVVDYNSRLRLVIATYPMIIIFRLFKAFSAQPRLAIVTETLYTTGIDLMHFALVFASIFVTLAISGLVLFGRSMASFTTFPRALNTVFRIMLLDLDWETFGKHGVSRLESGVFLIITVLFLNLVFLNMTLSIVMAGYKIVKKKASSGDTLWAEIGQLWSRNYNVRRGTWVTLEVVLNALLAMEAQAKARINESREKRKSGRMAQKADNNTIVGRDCKCIPGIRVLPAEPDIAFFVGEGTVEMVSVKGDRARVRHKGAGGEGKEGEHTRDYDIGHDLNFELKLVPETDVIEFDHEDETYNTDSEVISPARLMKVVREHNPRVYMGHKQALGLCIECVEHYYKSHCEDVNQDQLLQLMRKVRFRIKKIQELIKDGSCQALSVSVVEDLPLLRGALTKLYKTVDDERKHTHKLIHQAEVEIADLQEKLQTRHPGEHAAATMMISTVKDVDHPSEIGSIPAALPDYLDPNFKKKPGESFKKKPEEPAPTGPVRRDISTMMKQASEAAQRESTWESQDDDVLFAEVESLLQETAAARAKLLPGGRSLADLQRTQMGPGEWAEPGRLSLASISLEDSDSGFGSSAGLSTIQEDAVYSPGSGPPSTAGKQSRSEQSRSVQARPTRRR